MQNEVPFLLQRRKLHHVMNHEDLLINGIYPQKDKCWIIQQYEVSNQFHKNLNKVMVARGLEPSGIGELVIDGCKISHQQAR